MKNRDLLIVIDMQNVYKEGEAWGCSRTGEASSAIRKLLDADICGDVVFTRFDAPRGPRGSWKAYNRENAAINGDQRLNDIMDDLLPYLKHYPVLTKSTYSSFSIPELCRRAEQAEHVVLCGVVAECCVLATAMEAIDLGYPVIYLKDAVSGLSSDTELEAEHIVSYLSPIQTEVMTVEEYLKAQAQSR